MRGQAGFFDVEERRDPATHALEPVYSVHYNGLAYAIAANVPRELLLKVAEIVYQQNSPDGAKLKFPPPPGKPS